MRTLITAAALTLALAACTGGGGGLTVEQLNAAKDSVHSMQPKADAMKALESLGAPAKSDENGMSWFAKDGDGCKELHVQMIGDMVGSTEIKKSACPE